MLKKKLKKFSIVLLPVAAFFLPVAASAACYATGTPQNFSDLVCLFIDLIGTTIPVVASLALLAFFWGLAKFILNAGNESGREEGKEVMKWGIVALFVLVSVWGIVLFLTSDVLGLPILGLPQLPTNYTH